MALYTIISKIVRKDNTFPDYLRNKKTIFFQNFMISGKLFVQTDPEIPVGFV